MLAIRDVHTSYGPVKALHGLSMTVGEGQVVALLGRNGMGKTTALRTIMGLNRIERGEVRFRDVSLGRIPSHRIARMGIGYVPQGRKIFSSLTVLQNLQVAAREGTQAGWTVPRILELFPNLAERLQHRGNKLSGGEQQMLAVGRALAGNPALLLMDEPTEGLAPLLIEELGRIIRVLKKHKSSILLVEQNVEFALAYADHVFVMNKGKIVEEAGTDVFRARGDKNLFLD